jgi:hypothetical protein
VHVVQVEQGIAKIALSDGQEFLQLRSSDERRSLACEFGEDAFCKFGRCAGAIQLRQSGWLMCGDNKPATRTPA